MPDAFISYARRDAEFVRRLAAELAERGKDVWVDEEGIRDAEVFPDALRRAIEGSDAFVFVISPESVRSDYCEQEVAHAAGLNKRIVPLALRPVRDEEVPEGVRVRNWIPAGEDWEFSTTVSRVVKALETDLEWERQHSRLTVKALEWEQAGRDRSFLLRGADLKAAERWLTAGVDKDPGPTELETVYLVAARKRVRRGRMLVAGGGAVVLAVVAVLTALLAAPGAGVHVGANSVAVINAKTDTLAAGIPVGSSPSGIAYGSGSLWVANQHDGTVSQVDPQTLQQVRAIPVGQSPTGIAASAGQVWVGTADLNPSANAVSLTRIDPEFDSPTSVPIGNVLTGGSIAVAAHGDQVWAAPAGGLLTRLDGASGRILTRLNPNASPAAIAIGDGAVWIAENDTNSVTRVDPTGRPTQIPVGNGPNGIAVGEGGVWVADSLDNAVVRIDPTTRAVIKTIRVGSSPAGIAVGAGSVWVADSGDGTVDRIDPRTDKVIARIPVGASPQALTVVNGRVWVTVDAQSLPAAGATGGATLRIDWPAGGPSYMDPPLVVDLKGIQLSQVMCAKLFNFPDKPGPAGARPTPEVAQSLPAISADGKTYTFKIRPGFQFSPPSDELVTAQTFKYSLESAFNPKMMSEYESDFSDIVGMSAYQAGKAPHISGIVARKDTLVIRLVAPNPDLVARLTEPATCAVPSDTPVDPDGVSVLPSAGPYYLQSFTPQAVVLVRNPNYRGSRPHNFERIEVASGMSNGQAVAAVKAGTADDFTLNNGESLERSGSLAAEASRLAAKYGPGSAAAEHRKPQFFVSPLMALDYLLLNTHRPLFSDVRMRQAVNYAINRTALAALGGAAAGPLPDHPTDDYLPPEVPGYRDLHVYPLTPDLAKARALANGNGRTAILYTANYAPCPQQAQIVKTDLAAIGLQVQIKTLALQDLIARMGNPNAPFDLVLVGFGPDFPDPSGMLNVVLEDDAVEPNFNDPTYERKLAAAARLSGPNRYLTYGKLDLDLARNAAPLAAFGTAENYDFFSARIGCQTYGLWGIDLNALCIRRNAHR